MRKQFFFSSLMRMLAFSLIPILVFSSVYLFFTIPEQQQDVRTQMANNLLLTQENLTLLLNDGNKVMNLMESGTNLSSLRGLLQTDSFNYSGFSIYKNIVAQLSALVNTRDYVDSIYVYTPNDHDHYLTDQGRVLTLGVMPDPDWLTICQSHTDSCRLVRRQVLQYDFQKVGADYLSIVEENSRGAVVVVNIKVSYFRRIFGTLNLKQNQSIMIVDGSKLLFSNTDEETSRALLALLKPEAHREAAYDAYGYLVVSNRSDSLGLDVISILPRSVAYASINRYLTVMLIAAAVCLIFSVVYALVYARRTCQRLYDMVDLIDAASHKKPLPVIRNPRNDIYGYILTNIVSTFLQNDYLQILLDERRFQAISLELSALQYQINPHFLSNTLQIIDFEVLRQVGRPVHANQMIEQLSDFLQYSLKSPQQEVTLRQEIEASREYVALMQARFGDKVQVDWDVEEACEEQPVPLLILQPLIENSIQHGLPSAHGALNIRIAIEKQKDRCRIRVTDNGTGVTPVRLEEIRTSLTNFSDFSEKHIGLQNLFRRLQLRFQIDQLMELSIPQGGGFCVTLTLPTL